MKFGTQVDYTLVMIFSYRDISDFSGEKNGGHFQNGRLFIFKFFDFVGKMDFRGWNTFPLHYKYTEHMW